MSLQIVCGDIVTMKTDVIVNAANSHLLPGTGVCGAVFTAAGFFRLFIACRKINRCLVGEAVMTDAYKLPAKKIIHTVGPKYKKNSEKRDRLLYLCYKSSLIIAKSNKLKSIAFPLISSGAYGYPPLKALDIAISAIKDFLCDNELDVYIVIYNRKFYEELNKVDINSQI